MCSTPNTERTYIGTYEGFYACLYLHTKGTHLDSMQRFCIREEASSDNELHDKYAIYPKLIFDTILKNENL